MNSCNFTVGIHAATIDYIVRAKDASGNYIVNRETGEIGISIGFLGDTGMKGSILIMFSESTQYITDNLVKACRINNLDKEVHVSELLGKKVWIYVKGVWKIGQFPGIDPPIHTEIIPSKYSQFFGIKPAVLDDPSKNGGIPKGIFVEFADIAKDAPQVDLQERGFGDE